MMSSNTSIRRSRDQSISQSQFTSSFRPNDPKAALSKTRRGAAAPSFPSPCLRPICLENPSSLILRYALDVTARRILWGKFFNCGQVCVVPDYLLVHEGIYDELLVKLKETIRKFYGDDPKKSPDCGRIVNERHHCCRF